MSTPTVLISILMAIFSASAFAGSAEIATGTEEREVRPVPAERSVEAEIRELFGEGSVPRVDHHDARYAGRGGSKQCRRTWQSLRRAPVTRHPAAASESIVAKAVAAGVNKRHVEKALATYLANRNEIPNQKHITIIDFNRRSNQKRMFIIELATGNVKSYEVAAGKGSDPNGDGHATHFSNTPRTLASSLGCSLAAGTYNGGNGKSLMMHGFEPTNDNSCERAIVMHGASYVGGVPGRSWGCPAVKNRDRDEIFDKVAGGGLICAYKDGEVKEAPVVAGSKSNKKKRNTGRNRGRRAR